MKLEHEFTVPVPPAQAWGVLLDVERVAPCMPGATLDSVDGDAFTGRVKVKVGPITVTYRGNAGFTEKDEAARRAVITASGKEARGSGTARATITAQLHDAGDDTRVSVVTDLAITGKPAQFGRGVMAEVGDKIIGKFAECLASEIGRQDSQSTLPSASAESAAQPSMAPAGGPSTDAAAVAESPPVAAMAETAAATPHPAPSVTPAPAVASAPSPAAPPAPRPRPAPDVIDLFDTAGAPVLKRVAPAAAAAALLVGLLVWRRRRG